jgi:DNA-binding NarL/FixJ family response regulator
MEAIKIILADDHVIVRDGIKALLEGQHDISVIGEASNGREALQLASELKPDLLIVDIRMPELNGIETTRLLPESSPNTKSLILTMHDMEEYVLRSIDSGAHGYLLKDTTKEEFIKAIHTIASGGKYFSSTVSNILVNNYLSKRSSHIESDSEKETYQLTKREKEILRLIVEGINNKDIAERLEKSIRTIEMHRFNMMKKLGVKNVVEMILMAKEKNLV